MRAKMLCNRKLGVCQNDGIMALPHSATESYGVEMLIKTTLIVVGDWQLGLYKCAAFITEKVLFVFCFLLLTKLRFFYFSHCCNNRFLFYIFVNILFLCDLYQ